MTDLSRPDSLLALRARFPYVEQVAYLNTAGASPSSIDVAAAAEAFHSTVKFKGIDGRPAWREKIATMRARFGAYLNAPAEQVGFHGSCTEAMTIVAHSIADRTSFLVVADREDHPSVWAPWLGAVRDTVRIQFPDIPAGTPRDAALMAAAIALGAQAIAVSHVDFRTGEKVDLPGLSAFCRARGVLLIVDGTQAAGAMPVDATLADAYMGSAFKWLLCGFGLGYLVLSPAMSERLVPAFRGYVNEPPSLELRYRHMTLGGLYELDAALGLLEAAADLRLSHHAQGLASALRQRLIEDGYCMLTPRACGGIVTIACDDSERVALELMAKGISVTAQPGALRASTHVYNLDADIDRYVRALADIDRETSSALRSARTR